MKKFLILLMIAFALFSCGTNTSIVNSWRDPKITVAQENFKKVLVVALVKDEASRRVTENRIAASNEIFKTSYQYLNETTKGLTQDQKLKILQDENFDGVITLRLVSTEKETEYVPGSYTGMYYEDLMAYTQECTAMVLEIGTECIRQIFMIQVIIRKLHLIW